MSIVIIGTDSCSQNTNQQHVANQLACAAVAACASLGGYSNDSPENPAVRASLSALLTPYLARKLTNPDPSEVSQSINTTHIALHLCPIYSDVFPFPATQDIK